MPAARATARSSPARRNGSTRREGSISACRRAVSRLLSVALKDQDDLDLRLAFLLDQINRLRQSYADRSTDKDEQRRRRR